MRRYIKHGATGDARLLMSGVAVSEGSWGNIMVEVVLKPICAGLAFQTHTGFRLGVAPWETRCPDEC